jgi:hypothetical protein
MTSLVFLLEEPSAEEMLKGVLPNLLPDNIDVKYVVFEGKQDLEKQLEKKLKLWQKANSFFIVMRDKDGADCVAIKKRLSAKVLASGKQDVTLIRIACTELESFYLGDLAAVEQGLEISGLVKLQGKKTFRASDNFSNAKQELQKITKQKYQEISGSRAIAPYLKTDGSNCSHSFNVLLTGITKLVGKLNETQI